MQLFVPTQTFEKKANVVKQWKSHKSQNAVKKQENFIVTTWKSFTRHTSIHGVHYLTETAMHLMERIIWALAIILASVGMVYSCILLSNRFRTSLLSTVFESTNFPISKIPFAAVTICNNNHLNYTKTNETIAKFFAKPEKTKLETFLRFLDILQNFEFGSFDEFPVIEHEDVSDIDKLNLTEIHEFMMLNCDDFFVACWWKRTPFKCCEWFSLQKSMYGLCWSFNSYTSVGTKFVDV